MCARHAPGGGGATGADLSLPSNSIRGSQNTYSCGLGGRIRLPTRSPHTDSCKRWNPYYEKSGCGKMCSAAATMALGLQAASPWKRRFESRPNHGICLPRLWPHEAFDSKKKKGCLTRGGISAVDLEVQSLRPERRRAPRLAPIRPRPPDRRARPFFWRRGAPSGGFWPARGSPGMWSKIGTPKWVYGYMGLK